MNMRRKHLIITIVASLGLSACATIFSSDSQSVSVRASNGASFEATLSDGTAISVPGTVNIQKVDSQLIQIFTNEKNCASVTTVNRRVTGAFWGNIIGMTSSSGIPSSPATDYVTGKMWNYDTNVVIPCGV